MHALRPKTGFHPNLIVRRGKPEDAGLLAELGARTFSETFASDNTPENMTAYLASSFSPTQQAAELADTSCFFKIAETNGVAVGYAMLRSGNVLDDVTGDRPIELVRLYVSQESLGSSVGAALMQACIGEAMRRGHKTLCWVGIELDRVSDEELAFHIHEAWRLIAPEKLQAVTQVPRDKEVPEKEAGKTRGSLHSAGNQKS